MLIWVIHQNYFSGQSNVDFFDSQPMLAYPADLLYPVIATPLLCIPTKTETIKQ